jgi:hypothetical protein
VNDAHGSDRPFLHAISVWHHHKSDQRLRPTLPSHSQHISKKLTRIHLIKTNSKRKHPPQRDITNHPRRHIALKTLAIHLENASETLAIAPKPDVTRAEVAKRSAMRPGPGATTVPAVGLIALAMDLSRPQATKDRQAVESTSHCNRKRKIPLNSTQCLTGLKALDMIIGAKSNRHLQHRMIPCTDTLRRTLMNTDIHTAATTSATRHGNIGKQMGRSLPTCNHRSITIIRSSLRLRTLTTDPINNLTPRCMVQQPLRVLGIALVPTLLTTRHSRILDQAKRQKSTKCSSANPTWPTSTRI